MDVTRPSRDKRRNILRDDNIITYQGPLSALDEPAILEAVQTKQETTLPTRPDRKSSVNRSSVSSDPYKASDRRTIKVKVVNVSQDEIGGAQI